MVHADASKFADGVTKQQAYEQVLAQAEGLFDDQRHWVCNLANAASLLWHAYKSLPAPSNKVNWAGAPPLPPSSFALCSFSPGYRMLGFYTLDPQQGPRPQLILGPFQGKVACQKIAFGRGVCGAAAASQTTQLVPDVEEFPGHIACDGDSKSEVVVPIVVQEGASTKLVAIIDIDCAELNGFDDVDRKYLEELANLIGKSCDW
ncbi:GAF domain-like protein [Xylariales sp. AK1849]|nr:GAF domain-like protein [Xylariales sp. AK1849]